MFLKMTEGRSTLASCLEMIFSLLITATSRSLTTSSASLSHIPSFLRTLSASAFLSGWGVRRMDRSLNLVSLSSFFLISGGYFVVAFRAGRKEPY